MAEGPDPLDLVIKARDKVDNAMGFSIQLTSAYVRASLMQGNAKPCRGYDAHACASLTTAGMELEEESFQAIKTELWHSLAIILVLERFA